MAQLTAALNYEVKAELNVTPLAAEPTWADLGITMKNVSKSLNEVIYQASYLADGGWGSTEVVGGQYIATFTGDKKDGDPVSDFIFNPGIQYKWGAARKTTMRLTKGTVVISWPVTLANITDAGGDSTATDAVTLAVHGNGKPTIGSTTPNTSSKLASLTIGSLTLSPTFSNGQYGYTATTSNATDVITVVTESGTATAVIKNGASTVVSGAAATWATGQNVVVVTVTNGGSVSTYTVLVTK